MNDGDHRTEKRGKVNWNAELIWKMRMELAYQWDLLEDDIPIFFTDLLQSVKRQLLDLKSHLRGKLNSHSSKFSGQQL
jgi:hypothetical protein